MEKKCWSLSTVDWENVRIKTSTDMLGKKLKIIITKIRLRWFEMVQAVNKCCNVVVNIHFVETRPSLVNYSRNYLVFLLFKFK